MIRHVFHLIPHTHWDREWYLDRAGFLARLLPMLDAALRTMETQPDTPFVLDGQAVIVQDCLDERPDLEPRIRALVRQGRLQVGPWHVLADELIPSGESMVRNLLLGRRDCAALGATMPVLYSPDAFGHPAALPRLAAEFGMTGIVLWRGRTGASDLFRWRAADDSEALTYQLPRDGYEVGMSLPSDAAGLARAWPSLRKRLVARAAGIHVAVFVGADHHPLRDDLPTLRDALQQLEPDADVRLSRLDQFLAAAGKTPGLAVETGELRDSAGYTWSLQGVHGTRLPLKRLNARTELLLERVAEPLVALARHAGSDSRLPPLLPAAWRRVVESQFHDTIAGTVTDQAASDATRRLESASELASVAARGALASLTRLRASADDPSGGTLVVWNPRTTQAGGIAVVRLTQFLHDVPVGPPGGAPVRRGSPAALAGIASPAGTNLPMQLLGQYAAIERVDREGRYPDADAVSVTRLAVEIPPLPGLGVLTAAPTAHREHARAGRAMVLPDGGLDNGLLRVRPRDNGSFDLTAAGHTLPSLVQLGLERDDGDCYTVDIPPGERVHDSSGPTEWRTLASGPLIAAVEGRFALEDLDVRMQLELRRGEQLVRIRIDLDNRGSNRRLRARIPVAGAASVLAGAPFGVERRRAARPGTSWKEEAPVPTAPAHRFVAAAGPGGGLAVLAPGHFEYELDQQGNLLLTLLRSVGQLSRNSLRTRRGHAAWPVATPGAQCQGPTSLSLALAPCSSREADDPAMLHRRWEEAFLGPVPAWFRGMRGPEPEPLSIELVGHGLVTSAILPAWQGDGIILRSLNLNASGVQGAWRLRPMPSRAWRVRADETPLHELALDGEAIPFESGPHELVSVLVQ